MYFTPKQIYVIAKYQIAPFYLCLVLHGEHQKGWLSMADLHMSPPHFDALDEGVHVDNPPGWLQLVGGRNQGLRSELKLNIESKNSFLMSPRFLFWKIQRIYLVHWRRQKWVYFEGKRLMLHIIQSYLKTSNLFWLLPLVKQKFWPNSSRNSNWFITFQLCI